jgi:hypothetical protein
MVTGMMHARKCGTEWRSRGMSASCEGRGSAVREVEGSEVSCRVGVAS